MKVIICGAGQVGWQIDMANVMANGIWQIGMASGMAYRHGKWHGK